MLHDQSMSTVHTHPFPRPDAGSRPLTSSSEWRRGLPGLVAISVVAVLGLSCCSSSKASSPTEAVTRSSTASSMPTAAATTDPATIPATTAPMAAASPLTGGVEYLHAFQTLQAARVHGFTVMNNPTSALADLISALGILHDAESAFGTAVKAIAIDHAMAPAVTAMLGLDSVQVADLAAAQSVTSLGAFSAAMTKASADAAQTDAAIFALGGELNVFTDSPTAHLAPGDLPVAIKDLAQQPISTETIPGGFSASYVPTGYQQAVPSGQLTERAVDDVRLGDTSIAATVVLVGKNDAKGNSSAFVICRSSATGTTSGDEYMLGYDVTGQTFIAYSDFFGYHTLIQGTSMAASSGASVELRADCVGSYLTLSLNGKPVLQVFDDQLSGGNVGISTGGPGAAIYSTLTVSGTPK